MKKVLSFRRVFLPSIVQEHFHLPLLPIRDAIEQPALSPRNLVDGRWATGSAQLICHRVAVDFGHGVAAKFLVRFCVLTGFYGLGILAPPHFNSPSPHHRSIMSSSPNLPRPHRSARLRIVSPPHLRTHRPRHPVSQLPTTDVRVPPTDFCHSGEFDTPSAVMRRNTKWEGDQIPSP